YGCSLPYCDEDGGPLNQLKMSVASILGTWLQFYPEDFLQSPECPCLKTLLAYVELSMPDSDQKQRACNLLAQLETLETTEAEGNSSLPPSEPESPGNPVPALILQPQSPDLSQPRPGNCLSSGALGALQSA
ncbi:unnamed protein product, partial [Rangifer tarandus platyrhynchus]